MPHVSTRVGATTEMPPFDPPLDAAEIATALPGAYSDVRVLKTGGQGAVFRATPVEALQMWR